MKQRFGLIIMLTCGSIFAIAQSATPLQQILKGLEKSYVLNFEGRADANALAPYHVTRQQFLKDSAVYYQTRARFFALSTRTIGGLLTYKNDTTTSHWVHTTDVIKPGAGDHMPRGQAALILLDRYFRNNGTIEPERRDGDLNYLELSEFYNKSKHMSRTQIKTKYIALRTKKSK